MGKMYKGCREGRIGNDDEREDAECRVSVLWEDGRERPLDPQTDLVDHSLTGFDWGNTSDGSAQLAFALAYDMLRDERQALRLHHPFKELFVSKFPHTGWSLTAEQLKAIITDLEDWQYHEDYYAEGTEYPGEGRQWPI